MSWRKTPAWITLGGAYLAATAGYVNAVGFISAQQHGLTHVTGQVTKVGIELSRADLGATYRAAMLVVWFFAGAVLSGAIIRRAELSERGRRYGVAMGFEGALLGAATLLLWRGEPWGDNLVAMAAGLQNAMATSYSGAVVRTTHMTGIVTDLGILVGHMLRGHAPEWPKMTLLFMLFASFLTGGVVGAWSFPRLESFALLPPAVAMFLASAAYFWRTHHAPDPHRHGAKP
ncbi:MAG: YoaK family protein [Myxococcota bacterium]